MTAIGVIDGGDGWPAEPVWSGIYDDPIDVEFARGAWRQVVSELREREALALVNGLQVKRYVQALILYDVASRHVIEEGAITMTAKNQPQYSPWWAVMKDADARAAAHESDLGLSPRRRAGIAKVNRAKKSAIGGGYLKSVPK